jgi:hypothetical protein
MATLSAGLCAGLLPGCNWFGSRAVCKTPCPTADVSFPEPKPIPQTAARSDPGPLTVPPPAPVTQPADFPAAPGTMNYPPAGSNLAEPFFPVSSSSRLAGEAQETGTAREGRPAPAPLQAPPAEPKPQPPPEKMEPLLEAMNCFLKNQPDKALVYLKPYQPSSQELYIRLLPVFAELTHKSLEQLDPPESATLYDQLQTLLLSLRSRSTLVLDKMCFCERIAGYGAYDPLPEGHTFRAEGDDHPGDPVQIYVELRNFGVEPCPKGFVTRLSSSVEIRDAQGVQVWYHDFRDREKPQYRRTPWFDWYSNYSFYVPHIPPGTYRLTIRVRDLTRPEAPRESRQSLEFRVAL